MAQDPKQTDAFRLELEAKLRLDYTFDDLNWAYFWSLYEKKKFTSVKTPSKIRIFELNAPTPPTGTLLAFPTAIANPELMSQLPFLDYQSLLAAGKTYGQTAAKAQLWIKKMQAGIGSSMSRASYLALKQGRPEGAIKLGAKGTDLFAELCDPSAPEKKISHSLVEVQVLQAVYDASAGLFAQIDLHDILSTETRDSVQQVWNRKSRTDTGRTYSELIQVLPGLARSGETLQALIPTLDRAGALHFEKLAPGGHGLFAVEALRAAVFDELRPKTEGRTLVAVLGNGEDLSSTPDPAIVGWMIEAQAAIVMITTEKTANDRKGGQIAVVRAPAETFATIIEQAQAKEAGQLALFEELGLRAGDQMAFFNTNMALFNYEVLSPKLKSLFAKVGEHEFMRIIAPDLIENWKGESLQLEGAMGSSLLNLDRYWRKHFGQPLVHFINVTKETRTRFFSPIKSAFDFFMQFHSDRFTLNPLSLRLENHRPGELPSVTLTDQYYSDVKNVLDSFQGVSVRDLTTLQVEGRVNFSGIALAGKVGVKCLSPVRVELLPLLQHSGLPSRLNDVTVEIDTAGNLTLKPWLPAGA